MKIRLVLATIGLLSPLIPALAQAQPSVTTLMDSCTVGLVPDEIKQLHSGNVSESFRDALCGSWYNQHKDTTDAAFGANAVIKVVPVGVSFSDSSASESISKVDYCRDTTRVATRETVTAFFSRIVPPEGRTAWLACVQTVMGAARPHPINLAISGDSPQLSITWNANVPGAQPVLTGVDAVNLNCSGPIMSELKARPPKRKKIPSVGAGLAIPCAWEAEASVASIIVHTTAGDEVTVVRRNLPASATISVDILTPHPVVQRQERTCGDWSGWTTDMDGWSSNKGDGRCTHRSNDGKWCKGDAGADVKPKFGGVLSNPAFECTGGGCGWNPYNDPREGAKFEPTAGGGFHGSTWIGGKSVQLMLCATETLMGEVTNTDKPAALQDMKVARGGTFVVSVPKSARGAVLNITWAALGSGALQVGKESPEFSVVSKVDGGDTTKWVYRLNR